jgi:hypothetical protein
VRHRQGRAIEPSHLPDLIEVRWVNRVEHPEPGARIVAIGGLHNGATWTMSQSDAIVAIEHGAARFYARIGSHSVAINIGINENGNPYLRCATDGAVPITLLSLPECPPKSSLAADKSRSVTSFRTRLSVEQLKALNRCAKGISLRFDDRRIVLALINAGYVQQGVAGVVTVTAKGDEYLRTHFSNEALSPPP